MITLAWWRTVKKQILSDGWNTHTHLYVKMFVKFWKQASLRSAVSSSLRLKHFASQTALGRGSLDHSTGSHSPPSPSKWRDTNHVVYPAKRTRECWRAGATPAASPLHQAFFVITVLAWQLLNLLMKVELVQANWTCQVAVDVHIWKLIVNPPGSIRRVSSYKVGQKTPLGLNTWSVRNQKAAPSVSLTRLQYTKLLFSTHPN